MPSPSTVIPVRDDTVTWKVIATAMGGVIIALTTMFLSRQEATLEALHQLAEDNKLQIVALIQTLEGLRSSDTRHDGALERLDAAIEKLKEQVRQ